MPPHTSMRRRSARTSREGGKRARTRAQLLDAASALIAERGLHAASLEAIAARAGMTRGAIYGNFRDKEELFVAVAEAKRGIGEPSGLTRVGSLRELLRIIADGLIAQAPARQAQAMLAAEFQLYALTHPKLRAALARRNAELYREQEAMLRRLLPANRYPMPVGRFVRVLHALSDGLLLRRFMTPSLIGNDVIRSAFDALA